MFTTATVGYYHYATADGNGTIAPVTAMPTTAAPLAALSNVIVEPSNNLFSLESHYVIGFTTATDGAIKVITITFPAGFDISDAKLIMVAGISSGGISVAGQTLTFTVNSPVSVLAGTNIMLDLGKTVNSAVASNTVSVTTRDTLNNIIDGPTTSTVFTLKAVSSAMLGTASVTNSKIGNGAVTNTKIANNSINGTQIQNGTVTNAKIAINAVSSATLGTASVTNSKIGNGAVTNTKIANNSINGTQIIDDSIKNVDLSSTAAIALSKLATGTLPSGIKVNSANIVENRIITYDLAPGAISAPILIPVADTPVSVMGVQTNIGFRGVGQVTLLHIPGAGGFLEWVGLESTAGAAITQGFSSAAGTHIVFIDFSHCVDIEVHDADNIQVHNGCSAQAAGKVKLTW